MYHPSFSLTNNEFLFLSYPRVLVPGGLASHHIAAGTLGILAGLFHLNTHKKMYVFAMEKISYNELYNHWNYTNDQFYPCI